MEEMTMQTAQSGWQCSLGCAGPCFAACAAGAETGPLALAIVTGSFYYSSLSK